MIEIFEHYIIGLVNDVPRYIYEMLISLGCICIPIFFAIFKWKTALKFSFRQLFGEYLFLIYSSTVIFRSRVNDISHNFSLFWSYKTYYSGKDASLLPEIIMNIAVFIPYGFLIGAAFPKLKWWEAILMGFLVSVSIESIQYFFKLGVAEFDDVFDNSLGTVIGYSLFALLLFLFNNLRLNKK